MMKQQPVRTALVVVCVVLLSGLSAAAGGLYLGVPLITLDLSTTLTQLPVAASGMFDALESMFIGVGIPPAEASEIRTQLDESLVGIEDFANNFPELLPVPLIGGGIELGLPLVIIDGIRLSGGWLSGDLVRSIADIVEIEIPQPLVDLDIAIGEETGNVLVDLDFSAWAVSTEVVKRVDLLVLAFNFGVGIDLLGGEILPRVSYSVPPEMTAGVVGALDALHLDALSWSALAAHGMIGFELGPPFLRLYGDVRWMIPLSQEEEWWGLRMGPVSALLGFVIRF